MSDPTQSTERAWDAELQQWITVRKLDGVVVRTESAAPGDPILESVRQWMEPRSLKL